VCEWDGWTMGDRHAHVNSDRQTDRQTSDDRSTDATNTQACPSVTAI